MRVGIDASNIRGGGGLTHLAELLRAAQPDEAGVAAVTVWAGRATLAALPQRPWLTAVHEPLLDGRLPARLYWQRMCLLSRAAGCDVLFAPGGSAGTRFRPVVTMSQNLLPFEMRELRRYGLSWMTARLLLLRQAQAASFRNADGVVFLTEHARSVVLKTVGVLRGASAVIPHGVGAEFACPPRPAEPLEAYSAGRPFRLLYVSIVDVYKHQAVVAEAVARLRQAGLPVELRLVGPACAPTLRRLRRVIARHDPGQTFLRYLGPVPFADLPGVYRNSDAFVFASSCENLPNIVLEALASGLPIASSDRGPMPALLGDDAVFFNPEDAGSIAAALERLLHRPELRDRIAAAGFARAHEFSWGRCARDTFAFLARVARAYHGEREPVRSPVGA
jgi:glycosyltransferase involved in cell wall biosynthesis